MAKDVLEVLNAQLYCLSVETPEDQAHFDALEDAIDKLAELIAAISAERALYASEVRLPLDVEMDAYRRTGAALAACRGL